MLFFYPVDIDIISRQINFNHSSGSLKRIVTEKITIQNKSSEKIKEIAIEIERFRPDLKIIDEKNIEITFLTNEKLKYKKELPNDIKIAIEEKDDKKRKYVLWLILNKSIESQDYGTIFLNYIEYGRAGNKYKSLELDKLQTIDHIMYSEKIYYDFIDLYSEETLNIFSHWDDSLEISSPIFYYVISDEGGSYSLKESDPGTVNIKRNYISLNVSNSKRVENGISKIFLLYLVKPEKQQLRLIQVLTWFALLFSFTDFISVYFNNLSYLYDSLEVETVIILTLAFAETGTRLISYKKHIVVALLVTGILFIICLILLFNIHNHFIKFI